MSSIFNSKDASRIYASLRDTGSWTAKRAGVTLSVKTEGEGSEKELVATVETEHLTTESRRGCELKPLMTWMNRAASAALATETSDAAEKSEATAETEQPVTEKIEAETTSSGIASVEMKVVRRQEAVNTALAFTTSDPDSAAAAELALQSAGVRSDTSFASDLYSIMVPTDDLPQAIIVIQKFKAALKVVEATAPETKTPQFRLGRQVLIAALGAGDPAQILLKALDAAGISAELNEVAGIYQITCAELLPVKPMANKAAKAEKEPGAPRGARKVGEIMGQSVCAILRWLGRDGFTTDQARKCVLAYGAEPSDTTLTIQVRRGAKPKSTDTFPVLTDAQASELRAHKV